MVGGLQVVATLLHRSASEPTKGLVCGMNVVPIGVDADAEQLARQRVGVARGVVAAGTAAVPGVVAATVADRDVEVAVLPESEVPRVVVACGGGHAIEEDDLGGGVHRRRWPESKVNRETRFTGLNAGVGIVPLPRAAPLPAASGQARLA